MTKLYYTFQKTDSRRFLYSILADEYQKVNPPLTYSSFGKPYLEDNSLYFNLSHSGALTVLALSDTEIGADCERVRQRNYAAILKRLTDRERGEITSSQSFFANWTAKESYVKFLGSSIVKELAHLEYYNKTLFFDGEAVRAYFTAYTLRDYIITVCSHEKNVELIPR